MIINHSYIFNRFKSVLLANQSTVIENGFKHTHLQISQIKNMSNFHRLEVVGRVSETQLQAGDNLNSIT